MIARHFSLAAQRICTTQTVSSDDRARSWLPVDIQWQRVTMMREREPRWRDRFFFPLWFTSLSLFVRLSDLRDFSSLVVLPGSRAGELTRGCRLDADNAGGVSFVQSSMILCSSHLSAVFRLLVSSSLVFPCPRLSSACSAFPFRPSSPLFAFLCLPPPLLCLAIFQLVQRDELNRPNGSCKRSRTIVLGVSVYRFSF